MDARADRGTGPHASLLPRRGPVRLPDAHLWRHRGPRAAHQRRVELRRPLAPLDAAEDPGHAALAPLPHRHGLVPPHRHHLRRPLLRGREKRHLAAGSPELAVVADPRRRRECPGAQAERVLLGLAALLCAVRGVPQRAHERRVSPEPEDVGMVQTSRFWHSALPAVQPRPVSLGISPADLWRA